MIFVWLFVIMKKEKFKKDILCAFGHLCALKSETMASMTVSFQLCSPVLCSQTVLIRTTHFSWVRSLQYFDTLLSLFSSHCRTANKFMWPPFSRMMGGLLPTVYYITRYNFGKPVQYTIWDTSMWGSETQRRSRAKITYCEWVTKNSCDLSLKGTN
jgi:hypothetical protein